MNCADRIAGQKTIRRTGSNERCEVGGTAEAEYRMRNKLAEEPA